MKKLILAALALVVVLGAACSAKSLQNTSQQEEKTPSDAEASVKEAEVIKITAEEAKQKIDAGGVVILDVRTESEYAQSHIPGARLLPNESITEAPDDLPCDAVVLVYCRSGRRSAEAAQKLAALGYQNVYDFGGIIDWPYETESGLPQSE